VHVLGQEHKRVVPSSLTSPGLAALDGTQQHVVGDILTSEEGVSVCGTAVGNDASGDWMILIPQRSKDQLYWKRGVYYDFLFQV
jgi:hypothetical protein